MKKFVVVLGVIAVLIGVFLGGASFAFRDISDEYKIVNMNLPATQEWLFSQRPFLRSWPSDLPHLVIKRAERHSSLEGLSGILPMTAKFYFMVLVKSRDIVLYTEYTVTLNSDGKPKEIYRESACALFSEGKTQTSDGDPPMNAYFGNQLDSSELNEHLAVLIETGDIPEIRRSLNKQTVQLVSYAKDRDMIKKLTCQPIK